MLSTFKFKNERAKKRSVVFYRHSYYHFYYLAKALRDRGWDAITVNLESVDGVNSKFYHGEDLNLFDHDPTKFKKNIQRFFAQAKRRFKLMHFAGDGYLGFYEPSDELDPPDVLQWKECGNKIAYTVSGCNSGTRPSSVLQWSSLDRERRVCEKCIWQNNDKVCSEEISQKWGEKIQQHCDLICTETLPSLDYVASGKHTMREPLTMCLDPTFWSPDLIIPEEFKVDRKSEEILIYHAVGNYDTRTKENGRNIKGTPAVFSAIERLKNEGYPIKLIFLTDMKNTEVRYIQLQADIIVDQLNIGRYGATSREGMMLAKPVICYLNKEEMDENDKLDSLREVPLISATEDDLYEVLKYLINNKHILQEIGHRSREYAIKWHSAENCAERYEKIYDQLFEQGSL